MHPMLMTTDELDGILDRDDVIVVDVRSKMAFMASGHIPQPLPRRGTTSAIRPPRSKDCWIPTLAGSKKNWERLVSAGSGRSSSIPTRLIIGGMKAGCTGC